MAKFRFWPSLTLNVVMPISRLPAGQLQQQARGDGEVQVLAFSDAQCGDADQPRFLIE
jgi:hypothetical protein